jgi:hypothetical protein
MSNSSNNHNNNNNNDNTSNDINNEQQQQQQQQQQDFSSRMVDILNHGALNVAIGLGYKVGLFEALDKADEPMTAKKLAAEANRSVSNSNGNGGGLNERVVREWLGIVVSGDIVEIHTTTATDDDDKTDKDGDKAEEEERFSLPNHRGQFLCRRGGADNLAVYCQEIPLLVNCVYPEVAESFHKGQGIPYSKYPPFQSFMGELADKKHCDTLIQTFLPSIDDGSMVERLTTTTSGGGMRVLDVGCGEGLALTLMAKEYPNSEFVGIDLDEAAIATAKAAAKDLPNLDFVVLDATKIQDREGFAASFDYVLAFDAIHDLCEPESVLKGIYDALKPNGGVFSMIDIKADSCIHDNKDHPMGPLLYTVSLMHCMQVAMVNDGRGLGMMWGRQTATQMLRRANFRNIRELEIPGDGFNLHYMAEK